MLSSDQSEFDLFFDSADVLSTDGSIVGEAELETGEFKYGVWLSDLISVEKRRERFLEKMGLFEFTPKIETDESSNLMGLGRVREGGDDVVSGFLPSSSNEAEDDFRLCGRERNCGSNSMVEEEVDQENIEEEKLYVEDENYEVSPFSQREECRDRAGLKKCGTFGTKKPKRWLKGFLRRKERKKGNVKFEFEIPKSNPKVSRVKVHQNRKSLQELSAVYRMQEIRGHKGFIRAMKFSPDGRYLASGGEDGVVRIWRVKSISGSRLPLAHEVYSEDGTSAFCKRNLSQASVLLPENVFSIEETPVQQLRGHEGEVLDLAWSNSNHLLSASNDKTVRLWQVDSDQCLSVFRHNNYVTCIQFNPTNEKYFVSGSIDGKARIWGLLEERVVAWADVRDAVSAICYQPHGKGFVVGSITGTCRFYETSGNDVELEKEIHVQGRKKTSGSKITGIQFCPDKPKRVMITSEDSKVRILDGDTVVRKYKGLPKSGSQMSASFSSSGKHVISVGGDSRVYAWNYEGSAYSPSHKPTKSSRSCEHFFSGGASVAVPRPSTMMRQKVGLIGNNLQSLRNLCSSESFSLGSWFSLDGGSCRVSATWPEEKLPLWDLTIAENENCNRNRKQSSTLSDFCSLYETWGLVIVTGGWDGMIRTFHNYGLPLRL